MAIPIIPIITAAISGISALSNSARRKQEEKKLENMKTPTYQPNQSILQYYQKALQKYNTSPTDTADYKRNSQIIKQGTVQALSSLNKIRSGDVANVIQGQNNSLLNAAVKAENRKMQELGVLEGATRLKAGEDKAAYHQNYIVPFEKDYNLTAMKAAGRAQAQNAAVQNMYNNAGAAASILAGGDGMGGEGDGKSTWGSIFGNKGQRSLYRWNKGGQQWWQN